ncbi:unnamed protein product [Trichogramma brassicae]|uniref:Uncharacterized protein n=1 Tax=Trichogramma brassicae TaxID=86971 RepID=A0A6H5HW81_9HYME|nr:unnamed protein product [Trichogramma brassicae]
MKNNENNWKNNIPLFVLVLERSCVTPWRSTWWSSILDSRCSWSAVILVEWLPATEKQTKNKKLV